VLFDGWLIIARSIQRTCITSSSNTPTFFFGDTENRATTFSGKPGNLEKSGNSKMVRKMSGKMQKVSEKSWKGQEICVVGENA